MNRKLPYRPEIDGLRTIAVMAVIVFHLAPLRLRGGFLGVDVFLVISGFLITTIINKQIIEGSFSILNFWKRRIKRLYPALITVVGFVLLVSAFILVEPERSRLPLQAIGAIFSFENILLWKTTGGYWDASSENISLLHTWSLSLEERYYLFFPIMLLLMSRFAKGKERQILIGILLLSFCLCIYGTEHRRSASFYLLPTRMWELLIGSLLAIHDTNRNRNREYCFSSLLQVLGIILIIASFVLISNNENFPSFLPIFPCLGTLLIIMYGSSKGSVKCVLSSTPVVYIGKMSYSLYLWHWPVIVFLKYIGATYYHFHLVALCITFVMACLSYHFIECPFRYGIKMPRLLLSLAAGALVACFMPILILPSSPLLRDLGNINSEISLSRGWEYEATEDIRSGKPGLIVTRNSNNSKRIDLCVIGSSHARVLCSPIVDYSKSEKLSLISMATSGVGITSASGKKQPYADQINSARLQHIRKINPRVIIVAGMWCGELNEGFEGALSASLRVLSAHAERVIVLGQVPLIKLPRNYKNAMRKYIIALKLSGDSIILKASSRVSKANKIVEQTINTLSCDNVTFHNPYDLFIGPNATVNVIQDGLFLYSNHHHVNDTGAHLIFHALLRNQISLALGNRVTY